MTLNNTVIISAENVQRSEMEKNVIDNTKSFLESNQKDLMEKCYNVIRDNENERFFRNSIESAEDESFDSFFALVSLVIITANKIECDSLNFIMSKQKNCWIKKRKHNLHIFPNHNIGVADAYIIKYNNVYFLHINAFETGSNTPGGSTDIVRFISNHPLLKPTSIISFGVCYGRNPQNQKYGNVIIPQKLYPWSIGQKIIDKTLKIKNDNLNLWLFDMFKDCQIYAYLRDFCNGEDGTTIKGSLNLENSEQILDFRVKVKMGNMSTGEAVISSEEAKKITIEATSNYKELGGEMEGYGLAKECIYFSNTPCIIIKSICDWGVLKNIDEILQDEKYDAPEELKNKLQAYASFCAGVVLISLFDKEKTILYHGLINSLTKTLPGKNFLNGNTTVSPQKILLFLKHFFGVNLDFARDIFSKLEAEKIIIKSLSNPKEYLINNSFIKEVTKNVYF